MIKGLALLLACLHGVASELYPAQRNTIRDSHKFISSTAFPRLSPTTQKPGYYNRKQNGHTNLQLPADRNQIICRNSVPNYDCVYEEIVTHSLQRVTFAPNEYSRITFSNSRMEFFPKSLIDASPNLQLLNVASQQIKVIIKDAFGNASNLTKLYMNDNLITNITRNNFKGTRSLTKLVLSKNQIMNFNVNALEGMQMLQYLHIDSNRIRTIPSVMNSSYLEIFNASHNNIHTVGQFSFQHNSMLRELDISFNALTNFDMRQLNNKRNLQYIDVSSNQLTELFIPNFVQTIRAERNTISHIDPHRENCTVRNLNLSFNRFNTLPNLSDCYNLEYLDLSHNQLEQLDSEKLSALKRLGSLNLAHNHLFEILNPPKIIYSYLRWLDLSHNSLTVWPNNFQFWYPVKLALSSNKWKCTGLQPVINQTVIDLGSEQCQPDSNDNINDRMELANQTRDNYFHENLNNERLKERCLSTESYHETAKNEHRSNLREQAVIAESSRRHILLEMDSLRNQGIENEQELREASRQIKLTESTTASLTRNIDHFVNSYGVPREGLVAPQEMLRRVLAFVSDRNRNNAGLLARRDQEKQDNEAQLAAQQDEIQTASATQAAYKEQLSVLKSEEKSLKTERDKLRAQLNKNAPNIRGSTGKVA